MDRNVRSLHLQKQPVIDDDPSIRDVAYYEAIVSSERSQQQQFKTLKKRRFHNAL